MHRTRNAAWVQAHRGFESLPLRQFPTPIHLDEMWSVPVSVQCSSQRLSGDFSIQSAERATSPLVPKLELRLDLFTCKCLMRLTVFKLFYKLGPRRCCGYLTMKKNALRSLILAGFMLGAVPASACGSFSFISNGCFTNYQAHVPVPGPSAGQDALSAGFVALRSNGGNPDPELQLNVQSGFINTVSVLFRHVGESVPFFLSLSGFSPALSIQSTTVSQSITFTALVLNSFGAGSQLVFKMDGVTSGAITAELGAITVSDINAAPAPLAGAGLLSFLGFGIAALRRRFRVFVRLLTYRAKDVAA